jgi:DNA-binding NarL/FixJ family response regulator
MHEYEVIEMKQGRPSATALAEPPDEAVIYRLMSPDLSPTQSTPQERRIATERLLTAGMDRITIADLLGVDIKTVQRYVQQLREGVN